MNEERRSADRYAIWFPMQVGEAGDVVLAISRDVSEVGVLLVAAASLEVGAEVEVRMALPGDEAGERVIAGRVVRVEPNPEDADGLWRHRVAVAFDERVPALEPFLEQVARASKPPPQP